MTGFFKKRKPFCFAVHDYFCTMKKLLIAFGFVFSIHSANAQKKDWGSWTTVNVKKPFNQRWSTYAEFQLRSLSVTDRFYYYELKGGVTYSFLENYSLTLGTGLYNTFDEGPEFDGYSKQKEFRTWQQFISDQKLSIINIEHRYRIEQRFTDSYANRFRYRLNVSIPLNKKEISAKALYASVYDEVFFTDKLPHFSRNRFHTGAGYLFNKNITLQMGWLRQVDFLDQRQRRKNYFFTSFSVRLP